MPVERTLIAPPRCRIGSITAEERAAVRARSPVGSRYDAPVNRESAYEVLSQRVKATQQKPSSPTVERPAIRREDLEKPGGGLGEMVWGTKRRQGMVEAFAKSAARSVGGQLGRQILRGVLGGILGGSRRR
jgi:hypothetical protein